ncbi:CBS domain-containing protein [Thiohalocapsa marina]|uniref:CBS domain-containing protein n=1 Tax=Thiohalocapsa marina TaxID=424902 RepID=UPI0036D83937
MAQALARRGCAAAKSRRLNHPASASLSLITGAHVHVVTTHSNSDFDALASMVAAAFLYPGVVRVMPSQVQPAVREFLAVHWDLLQLTPRRALDPSAVTRLIVTDTGSWERLDDLRVLAARDDLETVVWDHHMAPGSIEAQELHLEEVGASVTLLLERLREADKAFAPMHATLFLLGIYDDTGALCYPSTTARDAHMAAYLLENGADLNVVSAYLESALDARHLDLFNRMLGEAQCFDLDGVRFGISVQEADKGLNNLARVVGKLKEIQGLDVAFGVFPLAPRKTVVVGRGNPRLFDVGALVRQFGGGGHPGAGSAIVKAPAEEVSGQLRGLIERAEGAYARVRDLMSAVRVALSPQDRLGAAADLMQQARRSGLLVLDEEGRLLGSFGEDQLAKVKEAVTWDHPVSALMRRQPASIAPEQTAREALRLMSAADVGVLPVVADGRVVGEVTRAEIILSLYDF